MNSINKKEIEKFSNMAAEWWDPEGKFKPLHKFNPIRIKYIKENIIKEFKLKNKRYPQINFHENEDNNWLVKVDPNFKNKPLFKIVDNMVIENEYKNQVDDTVKFIQGGQKKIFDKLLVKKIQK